MDPIKRPATRSAGDGDDPLTVAADPLIGESVGHFQICAQLGSGGMGKVYLADDPRLGRQVALKMLAPQFTKDADRLRRFEREARAASALNHPNIVTIYDVGESNAGRFIVMELVSGVTLRRFSQEPLQFDKLQQIGRQIAEALAVAHAAGIVHRDIKPHNIMVRDDGYVKVLDFGLVRLIPAPSGPSQDETTSVAGLSDDAMERTVDQPSRSDAIVGTAPYMSPEQAEGQEVTSASDLFSLGIVLYQLATGKHPFASDSSVGYLKSIVMHTPLLPSRVRPGVPRHIESLILKLLDKDPRRRPSAAEVGRLLAPVAMGTLLGTTHTDQHLVGRAEELAALQTGLELVLSGQSLLVCVAGEPGIGKTTVVERFLEAVAVGSQPCLIAKGQCSERLAGTEAYLPFLEVLESLLQNELEWSVAELMREKAPWWFVQVASFSQDDPAKAGILEDLKHATQERVKRELAAFFQAISSKRPILLFFEDLHWADVSSVDMLAYLAAKFDVMRLLFVTTYRPTELQLSKHPFLQVKPNLLSRGQCREIALGFLSEQEIERYLALCFPEHGFPAAFAQLIHQKTEGSPLFMVDLLRDLQARDVIVEKKGRWQLAQSVEDIRLELPDSVKGMIDRKIQQLGEHDYGLLRAASVQGFQFDSAVVSKMLDLDEEEVEERLQLLESGHRFLQLVEEGEFPDHTLTLRYRFVHVLYQNQLYASLTRTKLARLSRAAAGTLERFHGEKDGEVASELASLFQTGRDFPKALEYFVKAAARAEQVFAYSEVIILARRGLSLLEKLPESLERDQLELDLQNAMAGAIRATKGYGHAEVGKAFRRARDLAGKMGADPRIALSQSGLFSFYAVRLQLHNALELGQEHLRLAEPVAHVELLKLAHREMGVAQQFFGNFAQGSTHLEQTVKLDEAQRNDPSASRGGIDNVVTTLDHLAWNLWICGYPDGGVERSQEAKVQAEQLSDPFVLTHYLGFAGILHQCLGDAKKVIELSEENIAISEKNSFHLALGWANLLKGWALAQRGQCIDGAELMQQGLETWRAGMLTFVPYWHVLMAEVYAQLGRPDKGLPLLEGALAIIDKTSHHMWEAEVSRAKGELLLLLGNSETQVVTCYERALKVARQQQAKSLELRAAMSLYRLWQRQGRRREARDLVSGVYSWFTEGIHTKDLQEARLLLEGLR